MIKVDIVSYVHLHGLPRSLASAIALLLCFRRRPRRLLAVATHPSYPLDNNLPTHIQDLFEEWGQPIPIVVEYLEDEVELRAIVTNVNMHPKTIDFDMQDTEFDFDIDVEFCNEVTYRHKRLYGITTNYFVLE